MKHARILFFGLLASPVFAGCGSGDSAAPGDGGTSPDSSMSDATHPTTNIGADGSGTEGDGSGGGDGAADASDASDDTGLGCVATCPTCAAPQVCCALRCTTGTGNVMASCGDPATCAGPITCRGPQDCTSGQICCGSGTNNSPLDTMCVTGSTCPSNRQLIVCRTVSDCPPPVNARCSSGSSTANLYSTCRGAPPDSGAADGGDDGGGQPEGAEGGPVPDGGDGAPLGDAAGGG
jgi:hypothetical protein